MGMSGGQLLRRVELPLAVPYLATGLPHRSGPGGRDRHAGRLVGGGGLGTIINARVRARPSLAVAAQILAGGFLVAVLALLVNVLIGGVGTGVTPRPLRRAERFAAARRGSQTHRNCRFVDRD